MEDERAARIGANEAVFREVNERIGELNERFGARHSISIVCECGDAGCTDPIDAPLAVYERVRGAGELFLVVPGHEQPEVEELIETRDGYGIVRKREGVPAEVARETDPRA